jgi:glutathione synthase/RimK-type ligase-like ATP-grasp enzyme
MEPGVMTNRILSDTLAQSEHAKTSPTSFLGLAPFLRMSLAGTDFRPIAQEMLELAGRDPSNATLWMDLSIVMQSLGQRDIGLAIQSEALALKRVYHIPASEQPAELRLLMLMTPGDLSANAPLECLLESSDIDLVYYYVSPSAPLASPIPDHDILFVAISDSDETRGILAALEEPLSRWPKPVINGPRNIPTTGRAAASRILQDIPGLVIPPTLRILRAALDAAANGDDPCPGDCHFPIILRPLDSHAGRGLEKLDGPGDIAPYLSRVDAPEFFISPFVDYSGPDGFFRKIRIALVDGEALVCHMAVSSNWMIHYVNADMYVEEQHQKRAEEALFMAHFETFADRHRAALNAIFQRTNLEYLCIDCAETRDGQLLVFEINHAMVVHAMDPVHLFPYKQSHIQKVKAAMRELICRLASDRKSNAA